MAEPDTRAVAALGAAVVHDERALHRLNNLLDRHFGRIDLEAHAAVNAAQALDNARVHQAVLDRAGKRIGDLVLLGGDPDRHERALVFDEHGQHTQRIIGLPRYIHRSSSTP